MKKLIFAVAVSIAFAGGAMAQSAAPDAATVKAVDELMAAMKYKESMQGAMKAMAAQMPANMMRGAVSAINANPNLNAEQKKAQAEKAGREIPKVTAALESVMSDPAVMREMMVEMRPVYARHFTLNEIKQLTAFYRSPLGAKTLSAMPTLMGEGMQIAQKVMAPRLQQAMKQAAAK